jgi:hypothetical protein
VNVATEPTIPRKNFAGRFRIRLGLGLTLAGFTIFILGVAPNMFGLDRSPVAASSKLLFLIGLGSSAWVDTSAWRANGAESIIADVDRIVSTGYVIAVISAWPTCSASGTTPARHPILAGGVMIESLIAWGS